MRMKICFIFYIRYIIKYKFIISFMDQASLLSIDEALQESPPNYVHGSLIQRSNKKCIGITLIATIILLSIIILVFSLMKPKSQDIIRVQPIKIRIALPNLQPFLILLGNSRVIQILFYSGFDNRTQDNYKTVTQREVLWQTNPQGIVIIDPYGRLETLSIGKTIIKATSKSSPNIFAEHIIEVIKDRVQGIPHKRIINYNGFPIPLNNVMQKIITYKTKEEALSSKDVPDSIKDIINDPTKNPKRQVIQSSSIIWKIENYADGSNRSFVKRINTDQTNRRDRIMYMIGDRYLPGNGLNVYSIEDDYQLGIWVVNLKGEVSHIQMKKIGYKQKAQIMVLNTQKNVLRHGQASLSSLSNGTWVPGFSDNDGLWTSMYAAGEFMRIGSLKKYNYSAQQISSARESALYSLKAILLLSNIACRNTTVDARIRHFINTRDGRGQKLSAQFLKKGNPFSVNQYVGSPVDGQGFFGIDSGKIINQNYYGGKFKYSFLPFFTQAWSITQPNNAVTSKRTLNGYIARSFVIEALDGSPADGIYFKHNKNGTQTVLHEANRLYDYEVNDHPNLNLGNLELPQILKDFLKINGVQYEKYDLLYKGDTSTDQIIGHLFIYKIAFDILDESDPQENTLKELIVSTMINFCTSLINNGYTMVDATGQGTSWGKMTRTFMISDSTLEDSPIKSLQLLMSFKLCYYLTGDQSWQEQYQFLIQDQSFRYLDLVASVWKKWTYRAFNEDAKHQFNLNHLDQNIKYSQTQLTNHIIQGIHFSDQEQAFLGYYLVFQLQTNEKYLQLYRQGIEGWWNSVSRSQNQLWYYIYQLAYPNQVKLDYYGHNILQVSSWRLSRIPIDTRMTAAFIEGSRDDIILSGKQKSQSISRDPNHILQKRLHASDAKYEERQINYLVSKDYDPMNIYEFKVLPPDQIKIHKYNSATFQQIDSTSPNQMLPSTAYTLPYWMGVYHNMLQIQ